MTASELHRKLLFNGYNDVTDFLKNSPFNRYIYKQLLALRDRDNIETPILTVFNEIYYQCVKIQMDRKPGYDVFGRYLEEEAKWLDSRCSAELVFSFVWAIEKKKCHYSFNDECFIEEIFPLIKKSKYFTVAEDVMKFIDNNNIFIPYEYPPMPCSMEEIPAEAFFKDMPAANWTLLRFGIRWEPSKSKPYAWREITDNYLENAIEDYLRLYSTMEEQETLLSTIIRTFSPGKFYRGVEYDKLHENILNGKYAQSSTIVCPSLNTSERLLDPDKDIDARMGTGFSHVYGMFAKDEKEQEKQENQEIDSLKEQLERLKKNYESDLESIEAKYQAEIAALKKDLEKKATSKSKEEAVKVVAPEELYMTINEIVKDAQEWFHESGASELTLMLVRYVKRHHYYEKDELWKQIDSIIPAVEKRIATHVDINTASQVNINPQNVNNH